MVLNAGKTIQNKYLFWTGVFEAAVALCLTWLAALTPSLRAAIESLSSTIVIWVMAVLFIAVGLSGLELREKGVCFMLTFISWQQMNSYAWEASRPNTLTLRCSPRFPLMPGFMSIRVPASHREEVDRIVKLHIPPVIAS